MPSVAIVPAAGKGERFGGAKLLARIGSDVLLDLTLRSLLDAGVGRIVVVTAPGADFRDATLIADRRVQTIVNPEPLRGMFSSIQAGLAGATGDPVLILPADMPFVQPATIVAVADACERGGVIIVPVHQGERGHPIAFPAALKRDILAVAEISTLKDALAATGAGRLDLPVADAGILRDVDTPADLG